MPFAVKTYDQGSIILDYLRDKTTAPNYIYNGWAEPGTATSAAKWSIQRETLDANGDTIAIGWAKSPSGNFTADKVNVWDNRSNLSYSQ